MAEETLEDSNASTDANEVQGTSIDAALILRSMRNEIMAKELARELQSEQPINKDDAEDATTKSEPTKQVTFSEALLHGLGYLYPNGEAKPTGDDADALPMVGGYPEALPEGFYERLPKALQALPMEHKEYPHLRDAVLMGLLTVLSAVTPHCAVMENNKLRSCTLYTFVAGNPSAGKSNITDTKDVLTLVDKMLREEKELKMKEYARRKQAYDIKVKEVEKNPQKLSVDALAAELEKIEEPVRPFTPQIMAPQRTTEARFLQDVEQNQGLPLLMLLSEVKTLLNSNSREHGNYLDELLEIYDNTAIDKRLKGGNEELFVEHPAMAVLLTGVPNQVPKFFKGFDTGLESRFNSMLLHICTQYRPEDEALTEQHLAHVASLQEVVRDLYNMLATNGSEDEPYTLKLTEDQKRQMDSFFFAKSNLVEAVNKNDNAPSVVRRRRLDFKRLLFIITLYRLHEAYDDWSRVLSTKEIVPSMEDVDLVLYLVDYLIGHTLYVIDTYAGYSEESVMAKVQKTKLEILNQLPTEFLATEAKKQLEGIGDTNTDRTLRKWLGANLISRTGKTGRVHTYRKLSAAETQKLLSVSAKKLLNGRK